MKNILQLSTSTDVEAIGKYFKVVDTIDPDPSTGLDRIAIVKSLEIYAEAAVVDIKTVVYIVDANGNPLNGYVNSAHKNIFPAEINVTATNNSIVNLQTMQVLKTEQELADVEDGVNYVNPTDCEQLETLADLPVGTLYLPEFEAYRLIARTQPIDLFQLMENAIVQSTKI